jgi:hypothetical protein
VPIGVFYDTTAGERAKTLIAGKPLHGSGGVPFKNAATNGDSNTFVPDTPNWNPRGVGSTIDVHLTYVLYDNRFIGAIDGDGAVMANHEAFNLMYWSS